MKTQAPEPWQVTQAHQSAVRTAWSDLARTKPGSRQRQRKRGRLAVCIRRTHADRLQCGTHTHLYVCMYVCMYEYEGTGKPAARHAQLCECVGFLRIVVCAAGGQVRGVSRHACREFLCYRLQGWVLHAEALCAWRAQQCILFPSPRSGRQAQQSPTIGRRPIGPS